MFQKYRYLTSLFNRPGIQTLLKMSKEQTVNCIVVKDFSRLGRNYLEVGNYLEQIFPFLGIRFISVNDNFDSFKNFGAAGAIDVGFKNIVYEAYSKDLSMKIKSVRRSKAEQGKFVSAFAPYGYVKDKDDIHRLIVDEDCAVIIRRIYDLLLQGIGQTGIAKILNKEDVPSPMMVRKARHENFHRYQCNEKTHWKASTVSQILADQRYTGDAIYGKVTPKSVGSRKDVAVPKEDWIIVPDVHPVIIERDIFEAVQAMKKSRIHKNKNKETPLQKKVICRVCNHALIRKVKGKKVYFQCTTPLHTDIYDCNTDLFIEGELESMILDYLKALSLTMQEVVIKESKQSKPPSMSILSEIKEIQAAIEQKEASIFKVYEAFKANKVKQADYLKQMNSIKVEISALKEQHLQLEKDYQIVMQNQNQNLVYLSNYERVKKYAPFVSLSKEIVDEFIESIYIESNGVVAVRWRFTDPLTSNFNS